MNFGNVPFPLFLFRASQPWMLLRVAKNTAPVAKMIASEKPGRAINFHKASDGTYFRARELAVIAWALCTLALACAAEHGQEYRPPL